MRGGIRWVNFSRRKELFIATALIILFPNNFFQI